MSMKIDIMILKKEDTFTSCVSTANIQRMFLNIDKPCGKILLTFTLGTKQLSILNSQCKYYQQIATRPEIWLIFNIIKFRTA